MNLKKVRMVSVSARILQTLFIGIFILSATMVSPVRAASGPDLVISKVQNGTFTQGDTAVTYTLTVTNLGDAPTSGDIYVKIYPDVPAGLTATGMNGVGWTCAVELLECTRADAAGVGVGFAPITLTVDVALDAPSQVIMPVLVEGGGEPVDNHGNNEANAPTNIVQLPDLVIAKSHTDEFSQGARNLSYSIIVTNNGYAPTDGTLVTVTDDLPAGLTAVDLEGDNWDCELALLTCTRIGVLPVGESYDTITLTVDVDLDAPALVINSATVAGGGERDTSNNTSEDPAVVDPRADLVITGYNLVNLDTKLPLTEDPQPNEPFGIQVLVKNQGSVFIDSVFYTAVFVNRDPEDGGWFEVTSPEGCLYNLVEEENDWGDYRKENLLNYLAPGATDTDIIVEIPSGFSPGSYQFWFYADPLCAVQDESSETNNAFGPVQLTVGNFASGPTDIDVTIGGDLKGTYDMEPGESQVVKYALDGGPVVIGSDNGVGVIASLNQWRRRASTTVGWTGVSQSMALPLGSITNGYVMPRYDYSNTNALYNAILLANVDTVSRNITVTIGGTVMGIYTLGASQSQFVTYPGVVGGPVVVSSASGARIVASLYELIRDPSLPGWNGQSEMIGLPVTQLSDQYLIPMYFGAANPNTLNASLYVANVDVMDAMVEVKIAGVSRGTYFLASNTSIVLKYAIDGGPIEISSDGANIVASLNQWRRRASTTVGWTGVSQSMALPLGSITNGYVMPRYDYSNTNALYNAILLANVDTVSRNITVTIGGTVMGIYTLGASQSQFVTYPGVVGGPVVVSSASGARIVASLYELIRDPSLPGWNGQSEMIGLPVTQLSDQYLIPMYFGAANPNTLNASLYIAVP